MATDFNQFQGINWADILSQKAARDAADKAAFESSYQDDQPIWSNYGQANNNYRNNMVAYNFTGAPAGLTARHDQSLFSLEVPTDRAGYRKNIVWQPDANGNMVPRETYTDQATSGFEKATLATLAAMGGALAGSAMGGGAAGGSVGGAEGSGMAGAGTASGGFGEAAGGFSSLPAGGMTATGSLGSLGAAGSAGADYGALGSGMFGTGDAAMGATLGTSGGAFSLGSGLAGVTSADLAASGSGFDWLTQGRKIAQQLMNNNQPTAAMGSGGGGMTGTLGSPGISQTQQNNYQSPDLMPKFSIAAGGPTSPDELNNSTNIRMLAQRLRGNNGY